MVFLVLFSEDVLATHEADHRYVISGFVRDGDGAPIGDATLHLEHKGGEKKQVKTNGSGYYEILFHLHNDNLGDEILVRFGDIEKKIKVQFDPEDSINSRGDSVDFGADARAASIWVYLTGVSLVVMVVVLYIGFGRLKRKKKALARQKKRAQKKK